MTGQERKGKATKGKEESIELCADCCSKCVSAGRSFPCAAALAVNVHSPAIHARASCCCYTQLYYYSLSLSLSPSHHTLRFSPCSSCQGRRLLLCLDAPFFTLTVFIAAQLQLKSTLQFHILDPLLLLLPSPYSYSLFVCLFVIVICLVPCVST